MLTLQVFDPPMCCSTGVCGPNIDPALVRFAADLDWLRQQGIRVDRFNLAQQPVRFADDPVVRAELERGGTAALPLLLVDGRVVHRSSYPTRAELRAALGLPGTDAAVLPVMNSGCCGSSGCC